MPDNTTPSASTRRSGRKPSAVPREVVMTLQRGERILSYATGAIALLFAIVAQILISVGKTTKSSRSGHELVVALLVVFAVALLVFARKSKRAGVIFCNMFLLLILGIANGAVFLFSGGYLMIRALRLQRYGDATFAGSSKIARERAKARKEGRDASAITAATLSDAPATEAPRKAPAPSARYTPKKQRPRRK